MSHRRSNHDKKVPFRFNGFVVEGKHMFGIKYYFGYAKLSDEPMWFSMNLNKSFKLSCFIKIAKYPKFVRFVNDEMEALNQNGTWIIIDLPKRRKRIGCKWVYKLIYKSSREIKRFKSRLVIKDI